MKQYHRYQMDFESNWVRWAATCVGASIFLLVLRYLVLQYLEAPGHHTWNLWVPMGLGTLLIVLLRGFRLKFPGVYAVLGTMICIWLIIRLFSTGNTFRIVLGTVGYLFSAGVLIFCAGGFLPGRLPAAMCFAVIFALRIVLFDLGRISGVAWLPTLAEWGFLAALICLPMAMIPEKRKD